MLALDLLKRHEGFRAKPYRCTAGKLTIGYGRNLDDVGISEKEAEALLANDVAKALEHLRLEPYWLDLNEERQAVLLNMVVNLGWPRFSGFAKMRQALKAGDYDRAADEMQDSAWYRQVKGRAVELESLMRG